MNTATASSTDIFMSYAREDRDVAERLYKDLKREGLKAWIDVEDLLPGEDWRLAITNAIKRSTYFLALMSSRSLAKRGFVQKELRLAYDVLDELPTGHIFLIPIRLEHCEPVDPRITALNWVDFFPSYERGLRKLLKALKPLAAGTRVEKTRDLATCPHCGQGVSITARRCPACANELGSPNVRKAMSEAQNLDERYRVAIERMQAGGLHHHVAEFEKTLQRSEAVITTTLSNLLTLLTNDHAIYAPYDQIDPWSQPVRNIVDAVLFPGYAHELRFGTLSLDGRGLRNYGRVWIALDEKYIAHRATVTENDSFLLVSKHLITDEFPPGFMSTWNDRHKLAVAKLADMITMDTVPDDFSKLLLREAGAPGTEDFMEVQIDGPIMRKAFKSIIVHSTALSRAEQIMLKAAKAKCRKENLQFRVDQSVV
jgi:hypothetical protein